MEKEEAQRNLEMKDSETLFLSLVFVNVSWFTDTQELRD